MDEDSTRDEWGTCLPCNGHGSIMVDNGDGTWGSKDCRWCDGTDAATPQIERQIESDNDRGMQ